MTVTQHDTFLIFPDGSIDSFEGDEGDEEWTYQDPTLFDTLVLAGYPIETMDFGLPSRTYAVDVSIDPVSREVTAYRDRGGEVPMGRAGELFAAWYDSTRDDA
jgi:hypothetical protein